MFAESDFPLGVFGFVGTETSVNEPLAGAASVAVQIGVTRTFGTAGNVSIGWAVDPAFASDFDGPMSGTLVFVDGSSQRKLSSRTSNNTVCSACAWKKLLKFISTADFIPLFNLLRLLDENE